MACNRTSLIDYLDNFTGNDPIDAVACAYAQDSGAGMGMPLFFMFVASFMGLALTVRVQHPAPVVVAGMLSAGLFAALMPGILSKIFALVLFFAVAGLGIFVYNRAKSEL